MDNIKNKFNISFIENIKSPFFLFGLLLAFLVWLIDPIIDAVFLGEGTISDRLFHPDTHEMYMRMIISLTIIIYSFIANVLLNKSKQLNTALEDSERSLQLFVDNAPSAIALFDKEMTYLAYSRRYLDDFDLGDQNLIGRSHYDIFPEAPDHWKEIHQRCIAGEVETCDEDSFIRVNGKLEWTKWEIHPWYKTKEEIGGIIFFCEVITQNKEIEKEKNKNFELLQNVINTSQDYIFVKDKELRTILCNNIFAAALNKKPEELYGKTDIENGWNEELVYGNPEKGIRGYINDDKEVLTGKTLTIESESANIKDEIRHFETIKSPLTDENDNVTGILAIARDISERIKSKLILQESEQRYRSLIEATTSIVWTTNDTGEFITPQDSWEKFTGQPWEEHQGFGWTNKIHPDDIELIKSVWEKSCKEKIFYETSGRVWNEGLNEWRDFEVHAVPINNSDGTLREWVGVITDITDRKRAEAALVHSEQRFRKYFELGLVGMATTSLEKGWVDFNDTLPDMFGYTRDEFSQLNWAELTYPDDLEADVAQFERVLAGEIDGYSMEKRFIHKNGNIIYAVISANAVRKPDNTVDYFVALVHDISEFKKIGEKISRYKKIFESSLNEIYLFDSESLKFVQVNKAAQSNLGYSMDELSEMTPLDLKPEFTLEQFEEFITPLRNSQEEIIVFETRHKRKDGSLYDVEVHLQLIEHEDGKLLFNAFILDISDRKRTNEILKFQASHDSLTGLINRQEFERRTERLLSTINIDQSNHALCFMDLDQFKVVNDTSGHMAGDEMLRQLSAILESVVRKRDTLARLGGDEFGVLMEHCSIEDAHRVASSIQNAIQDYQFSWEGRIFKVSVSIGLVAIDETTVNFTELLKNADAACYLSKEAGRNRIHIYNSEDQESVKRQGEMQWVEQINRALERQRFILYAQPIESFSSNTKKHFEFLIRMIDENGETVSPGTFLPAAERYNLMAKIDKWVINNTFNLINENLVSINNIEFISINISGQSITDPEILKLIINKLDESNINGNKFCFEITETAAISNLSMALKFINSLKSKGCQFALDDFGSGLSSFGYLKKLPVDYLKIDGMFVKDIVDDPIDHAMVKSINEIGHVMGMKTIAEFVENDIIKGMLKEIGVDYVQGYGIGKPEPIEYSK